MTFAIPKSFEMAHIEITVEEDDDLLEADEAHGLYLGQDNKVIIGSKERHGEWVRVDAFFHELFEMAKDVYELKLTHQDLTILAMAVGQALKSAK